MTKTISAMYARKNFGQLLNEVSLLNQKVIIERAGRPMAALVPVEQGTEPSIDPELAGAVRTLVKKIKGPRSRKLEKAIAEVELLLAGSQP